MIERVRPSAIPNAVRELCRTLDTGGYKAWIVGGCLRDLLRGKPASDWDLATSARPEQVQGLFPRVFPTGIQHGTVTVRHRGQNYEVTTLRGEGAYSDGRRPDSVEFVADIEADLARRDFTINAMAYDPIADQLVDPFGGLVDLEAGLVRAVGKAETRFSEDGLRVLRAARFVATLGFALEPATESAIRPTLATFQKVSPERVREEWIKIFKAEQPSQAFAVMVRTGILALTFEQLADLAEASLGWAFAALDAAPRASLLRLAALLSPLAEQPERVGAWLQAYRFSNQERERVLRMLASAWLPRTAAWSDAEVRRFARKVSREALGEVTELHALVNAARYGESSPQARDARELCARCERLIGPDTPLTAKELAVGGRELMQTLGLSPGPQVGRLIEHLLELVLDDPRLNTPAALFDEARELLGSET